MSFNISIASSDSDVFDVEQTSNKPSPQRNILNSTGIYQTHTARMPSVSSIASPERQILTINDDSYELTMPYGLGQQLSIVPPSLNDLNLPPNPINILATIAVVTHTQDDNNDYSPQPPEPYELSSISTPPMNVSTFDSWETSHTTTDENTFYSDDQPRRIGFLPSTPTPPPPRKLKRKLSLGNPFQKEGECRSTSAKLAVRQSPQQRTSQIHQTGNRNFKDVSNSLTNY